MSQCPKCATALKEDYGMVTCPACGAFLFIDMDGNAQIGEESEPSSSEESVDPAPFSFPPLENPEEPLGSSDSTFEPFQVEPLEPPPSEPPPESEIEALLPSEEFSMEGFLGYEAEPTAGASEAEAAPSPEPTEDDALGLGEFASSELSQAKDGLLLFRVLISGIDSKEIRESIREAIVDQRFGWDPARIMAGISKGVLKIDRLSPVKASILIGRIKRLPVKITWEQYAITQAGASE